MVTWHYLRFNRLGEPRRNNVYPPIATRCWGFDMNDHKIKICYRYGDREDDFCLVNGAHDSDCRIVAWAPISDEESQPDIQRIKQCGFYWPPLGTEDYERKMIRVYSHKKSTSKIGQNVIDLLLGQAQRNLEDLRNRANQASSSDR